ncbi:hypothetical protein CRX69_25885 [Pseudomonas rhizophila]|uniref:Uncharacterized protein n=1 Tax=Pseudomonas rhizophila TaxID=2045200 RepID=A0ABN5JYH8_9PSED|nr:hypothetical protein CRX69_25885 [Pseudomonas rhizophila]
MFVSGRRRLEMEQVVCRAVFQHEPQRQRNLSVARGFIPVGPRSGPPEFYLIKRGVEAVGALRTPAGINPLATS